MLVFFSNKWWHFLVQLGLISIFTVYAYPQNTAEAQRAAMQVRRQRAAYRYVQEVLSPPVQQAGLEEIEDPWSLKHRIYHASRILGSAGVSVLSSEAFMYLLYRIPVIKEMFASLEKKIKLCHDTIGIAKQVHTTRKGLREYFLGKNKMEYVKEIDATVIPDFEGFLLDHLEKKTSLENMFAWIKKGTASGIFFCLNHYLSKKTAQAEWTYKSILEKVIEKWPEHQYYFPRALKPRFRLLYDAYIARYKVLEMDEADAQCFIEWVCLEVIDTLMTL